MWTSERYRAEGLVVAILLVANALLFLVWPWRDCLPSASSSSDAPVERRHGRIALNTAAILRNDAYLRWFFDTIRSERRILFLGTSESGVRHNIGAQLNHLHPADPGLVVIARGGLSPIHQCLAFARCRSRGIEMPPMVLVINLIYFTRSHDGVNERWMDSVVWAPVFLQMDHAGLREHVTPAVQQVYGDYFALRNVLYPGWMQVYLGHLAYVASHQGHLPDLGSEGLPIRTYRFEGPIPKYDESEGVHKGYRATDHLAKGRWVVVNAKESVNLKGLVCSLSILKEERAPVLVLVLPVNRTYYAYHGFDAARRDARFETFRKAIAGLCTSENLHLLDLYDLELDRGFGDRMHTDAYGNYQLAQHIAADNPYARFLEAVRQYYTEGGR